MQHFDRSNDPNGGVGQPTAAAADENKPEVKYSGDVNGVM